MTVRPSSFHSASGYLGAFLCTLAALVFSSCGKKAGTPVWESSPAPSAEVSQKAVSVSRKPKSTAAGEAMPLTAGSLRFVSYNLENWLTMERFLNGKAQPARPKPESEKEAAVAILTATKPDVLGLCEIGSREDLDELQSRLKKAGLDLPHAHFTGGADPVRHLALLSRFPITTTAVIEKSDYRLEGKTFLIERGVLDASVTANGITYRFLGAHLKSKRDVEVADQAQMRQNEAHLMRDHIEAVLKADPSTRLVVYGDLNDTKASPAIKTIQGTYNHPDYLTALPLNDRQGQSWTHYWKTEDIYSRIDWILVSRALKPEVNFEESRVIDDPNWSQASDHRPVMMLLK